MCQPGKPAPKHKRDTMKHYLISAVLGGLVYAGATVATVATTPSAAQFPMTSFMSGAPSFVAQIRAAVTDTAPVIDPARGIHPVVTEGSFIGASDHETRGTATIVKTDAGYELRLSGDFYLDGAPTPVLGFGVDGEYVHASQFADLRSKRGAQSYPLPASFDPANVDQLFVWCERFDIPLGVADLK